MTDTQDPRNARAERAAARQQQDADRQKRGRNSRWRSGLRTARRGVGKMLTHWCLPAFLRLLAASWRVTRVHPENLAEARDGRGFLAALWHGEMLAPLPTHRGRDLSILVSRSGDGTVASRVLRHFGYEVVRGSSSRGSARALREMREHLERRRGVVITPDGPRGPRHQMNLGLAWLARETGCPILPLRIECDRAWQLKSWDRFLIPKPFAKVKIFYQGLLRVEPDADDATLERISAALHASMLPQEAEAPEPASG